MEGIVAAPGRRRAAAALVAADAAEAIQAARATFAFPAEGAGRPDCEAVTVTLAVDGRGRVVGAAVLGGSAILFGVAAVERALAGITGIRSSRISRYRASGLVSARWRSTRSARTEYHTAHAGTQTEPCQYPQSQKSPVVHTSMSGLSSVTQHAS